MDKFVIYDAVSDVKGNFSSEFRNYVRDEKLLCHFKKNYVFAHDDWLFRKDEQANDVNDSDLTNELITMFQSFPYHHKDCLVQFWKAEELSGVDDFGETRFLLTTRNQPFLISGLYDTEGICSYRMNMVDIVIGDRGGGGVIGRVYRSKRIEFTPNIGYYSSEENPLRDLAASCGINYSIAIPIYDSFGHLVGVLEAVLKSLPWLKYYMKYVIFNLQRRSNLRYPDLDHCKDLCGQCDLEAKSLHNAVSEIKKVMQVIGKSCGLLCAQTWMLCNHCGSLSFSGGLNDKLNASYKSRNVQAKKFLQDVYMCNVVYTCNLQLKKGEGVVGKAATSSHNLVYCEDVSKFSITEFPLAHFARDHKITASFAICLKSYLTGSQIYVLEFFLNPRKIKGKDLEATLVPILEAMKLNFRTFKVASGEEIGDNLFVQVIDAHSPDKIVPLRDRELDLTLAIGINNIESSRYIIGDPMIGVETSSQDTSMEETSVFSASTIFSAATVESKCWLNINVNYRGDSFTFQLSSSSEILELSQHVSRRLNLEGGTYNVTYLDDDNDWILLTCDEDLQEYIKSSLRQEKYSLMMTIEPK